MAIMDAKLLLSEDQSIATSSVGTVVSTNVVDLDGGNSQDAFGNATTPNVGEGGGLSFNVKCTAEDFAAGASDAPAVTVKLTTADNTGFSASSSGNVTTLFASGAFDKTKNAGDDLVRVKVPAGTVYRYVRAEYAVATAVLTAGKVTAWLGLDSETPK